MSSQYVKLPLSGGGGSSITVTDTSTIDLTLALDVLSADVAANSLTNTHINSSAAIDLTKLANIAASTIVGNNTGISSTPVALSATQATAVLNNMVGDSGSGGTKGLVPAPAAGDAAASKYLKADGTWATTPSGFANPMTTEGDLILATTGGTPTRLPIGSNTYVLTSNGTTASWQAGGGGGSGTVTSVGLSAPATFSVSGSPVTTSGTLALSYVNQSANTVLAGPTSGSSAAPAFRALVPEDLPAYATINTQASNYQLVLADAGRIVELNSGSAITVTIPDNSTVAFPVGTQVTVVQFGAGALTVVAGGSTVIRSPSTLVLAEQYATASLYKRATNEWVLMGYLQP